MLKKYCSHCQQEKSLTEFWKDKYRKDGYRNYCKECSRKVDKEYKEKNRARYRLYYRKSRQKVKALVLTYYGNGKLACIKCGESRLACLTIDHIKGGGTKHLAKINRYGSQFYQWLIIHKFPKGYQTLCANCQLIKRVENNENENCGRKN